MRKGYLILAAVATTFMASCSNEKVLNERQDRNEQTVIGFSTYNVNSTKADLTGKDALESYHKTFMVYGTKVSTITTTENPQYVFGEDASATVAVEGTQCNYVDGTTDPLFHGSNWQYETLRFWDKQATYNFIAYAPATAPLKYKYASATAGVGAEGNVFVTTSNYTLYGQNLMDGAQGATQEKLTGFIESSSTDKKDIDIMVSELESGLNGVNYANATPKQHVNLLFHHILAKLNVVIAKDEILNNSTVTIKSVSIDGLKHVGTYNGTVWTAAERDANSTYTLDFNTGLNESYFTELEDAEVDGTTVTLKNKYFIESLVMPQTLPDVCNLTIKYEIKTGTHTEQYTSRQDISTTGIFTTFANRTNYTLKIKISPTVITFDAAASEWDFNGEAGYTIY